MGIEHRCCEAGKGSDGRVKWGGKAGCMSEYEEGLLTLETFEDAMWQSATVEASYNVYIYSNYMYTYIYT